MRKEKALTNLLRGLVELIAEESERNPEFASKIEVLLSDLPERKPALKTGATGRRDVLLPDIHEEWNARGEIDFRLWLRDQPITVLRAIIRRQDFDSTRRTVKWKEPEKLAEFIADGLRARMARGSAFIGKGADDS